MKRSTSFELSRLARALFRWCRALLFFHPEYYAHRNGSVQYLDALETDIWRAEEYFSFVIMFMLGMGVSFEIPVLLLTLVKIGLIPHEWLMKGRRYFFVGNSGDLLVPSLPISSALSSS